MEVAEILFRNNLRFIGIVKQGTSRLPIARFGEKEMFNKGDFNSLVTKLSE